MAMSTEINKHTAMALGVLLGNRNRFERAMELMLQKDRRWVWRNLQEVVEEWWSSTYAIGDYPVQAYIPIDTQQIEWEEICIFFDDILDDMEEEE